MTKSKVINVINWLLGVGLCSFGIAICTKADYGLGIIAAPPYLLHVCIEKILPWFSQGVSEYVWEGILLVLICLIIRRFKWKYILSFVTAFILGTCIDLWYLVLGGNSVFENPTTRIIAFAVGTISVAIGVAGYFRTTLPLQVYELAVAEISDKFGFNNMKVKITFDMIMLLISLLMARFLVHSLEGIGIGTIIAAFVNTPLIAMFGKLFDKIEKRQEA